MNNLTLVPRFSSFAVSTSSSTRARFPSRGNHTLRLLQNNLLAFQGRDSCAKLGRDGWRRPFSKTSQIGTQDDEKTGSGDKASRKQQNDIEVAKEKQLRKPWHREGSDRPPVARPRSAGAMTKGKLLTTPSRLLKLVLPVTTLDHNSDRKDIAPLALLVHPQQPLSYLERLIQAELPSITTEKGEGRIPSIHFRAMEPEDDSLKPKTKPEEKEAADEQDSSTRAGEGGVESYSGAGRESKEEDTGKFVRWSSSTEIGDFVRDAARAKEFIVEIEGAEDEVRIGVPSFNDRTFYLRQRLRKRSRELAGMASVKKECDIAAHKAAQRLAIAGFGVMAGYWYLVYRLTFETDLGWDTMEPVTYLIGLSALMGGYLWFLYHNREVSYRAALNITISRRQNKLYEAKGFNLERWQSLIEEANALRKEIKAVAAEYDVEWNEKADEHTEEVSKALRQERKKDKSDDKTEDRKDDDG